MQNFFNADVVIFNKQSKPMHGYLEFSELGSTVPLNVLNPHEANMGNIIITNQYGKLSGTGAGTGVSQILLQDKNYTVRYYEFIGTIFDIQDPSQFELIRTLDYYCENSLSGAEAGPLVNLDTMVDLRNFDPALASYVELRGYYKAGDMWTSRYKFDGFNTYTDDGGSVIKSSLNEYQNGRWLLVDTRDQIDVKQFGIKSGEECSVQLLNAFNYCNSVDRELVFTANNEWCQYLISGGNTYECPRVLAHKKAFIEAYSSDANTFKIGRFRRVRDENDEAEYPFFAKHVSVDTADFILNVDEICTDDVEDLSWLGLYYENLGAFKRVKVIVNDKKDFHSYDVLEIRDSEILLNKNSYSYERISLNNCIINKNSNPKCFNNSTSYIFMHNMLFEAKYFTDDFDFKNKLFLGNPSEKCVVTLDNCRQIGNEYKASDIYLTLKAKMSESTIESLNNMSIEEDNYIKFGYEDSENNGARSNKCVLRDLVNLPTNIKTIKFNTYTGLEDVYIDVINCQNIKLEFTTSENVHLRIDGSTVTVTRDFSKLHVKSYDSIVYLDSNVDSLLAHDSEIIANTVMVVDDARYFEIINSKLKNVGTLSVSKFSGDYTAVIKNSEVSGGTTNITSEHLTIEDSVFYDKINFTPTLISNWDDFPFYRLKFNRNEFRGQNNHLIITTKFDEKVGVAGTENTVRVWLECIDNTALFSKNILIFNDKRVNLYDDKQHVYTYKNNVCAEEEEKESPVDFLLKENPPDDPNIKSLVMLDSFTDNEFTLAQKGDIPLYLVHFTVGIHFEVDVRLDFLKRIHNDRMYENYSFSSLNLKLWSNARVYNQKLKPIDKSDIPLNPQVISDFRIEADKRLFEQRTYPHSIWSSNECRDVYQVKMYKDIQHYEYYDSLNTLIEEWVLYHIPWGVVRTNMVKDYDVDVNSNEKVKLLCKLTVL